MDWAFAKPSRLLSDHVSCIAIRVLCGLNFFVRSRPAPTKFKSPRTLRNLRNLARFQPAPHFFGLKPAAVRKLVKTHNEGKFLLQ